MNKRIDVLQKTLAPDTAALILSETNRRYYTGFPASDGLLWVTADEACLLTDFRYIEAAKNEARDVPTQESAQFLADAFSILSGKGIRQVLIEDEAVTVSDLTRIRDAAKGIEVIGSSALCKQIWSQRRRKDEDELALMRQAQALTDDGFAYILPRLTVGRTEREIALDLEFYMRQQGAEGVAFDFIVASGENGSKPHAVPGDRRLQTGDFVTLDFGALVDGYRSDMTRTVAIGAVSDEQKQVYEIVKNAQAACLAGLRPGMTGEEGDRLARAVIEEAGYGKAFGHSTGHGVGLDIHEKPRLSSRAAKLLQAGEIVTVEPGIYLEGRFGVRIEDMVLLTEDGIEDFTRSPRDLIFV
ncbi:MAG: aminopeptidase P family protein [Clostridia bacterium]|nr:aminopeptidase P family protein [Clostridia bacterium]